MRTFQAIRTRYHCATNFKGSRISAQCEAGRIYVPYNHALSIEGNHKAACDALCAKLAWVPPRHAPMIGGCFDGDYYWCAPDLEG